MSFVEAYTHRGVYLYPQINHFSILLVSYIVDVTLLDKGGYF